ncbi:MAG: ergothioneine biosynthesis protein EgtB [Methylotenera sp.]|nr:ergothioneine biosynthesis protein EgtB [Oligoflexia bacterium]
MDWTRVLFANYSKVRSQTENLCLPLLIEDYGIQSMPDMSPPKWHLAHTTWFFETFLLLPHVKNYAVFDPAYSFLFNSYYESQGSRVERSRRGLLSRPAVSDVYAYRRHVDEAVAQLLQSLAGTAVTEIRETVTLGLHHEQQHQELLLTDIKHLFWSNPLRPVYHQHRLHEVLNPGPLEMVQVAGGLLEVGVTPSERPDDPFTFDLERPRHKIHLSDFKLASRAVTNGEYLEFIQAGGYQDPSFWLSDGWATVKAEGWQAPLYWEKSTLGWQMMTLSGMRRVQESEAVCHVSYYEADAYARFRGKRLPTEAEWEVAATSASSTVGNFMESSVYHPISPTSRESGESTPAFDQVLGNVWEWTSSPFQPYPGFRPLQGAFGEYNGKFMINQMVLRGGSCATPREHIRPTYRNFFTPSTRWQFSGIRLASDST